MTLHIHDTISDLATALVTLKSVAPPDGVGRLNIMPTSHTLEVGWVRPDETYGWHHPDDESRAAAELVAREDAKRFLGIWANRLLRAAAEGEKVVKTFGDYSVSVAVRTADGWTFMAKANADMVCEIRPVLDDAGEPVLDEVEDYETTSTTVTKLVPRTEKICPPSFLDGLADEAG